MKRFHFPLDRVRAWRHEQAELEQVKLQAILGELNGIDAQQAAIERELTVSENFARSGPTPNPQEFVRLEAFRRYTSQVVRKIQNKRQECESRVAKQRQAVIEARRQAELLEKLKKAALAEWKAAQEKEQEELAAELYLAKRRREIRS